MIQAILGYVEINWREKQYSESFVEHGMAARVKLAETWYALSGCAMLRRPFLRESGPKLLVGTQPDAPYEKKGPQTRPKYRTQDAESLCSHRIVRRAFIGKDL